MCATASEKCCRRGWTNHGYYRDLIHSHNIIPAFQIRRDRDEPPPRRWNPQRAAVSPWLVRKINVHDTRRVIAGLAELNFCCLRFKGRVVEGGRDVEEKKRRIAPRTLPLLLLRERAIRIATSYREEKLEPLEIIAIFSIGRHVNAGVIAAGN